MKRFRDQNAEKRYIFNLCHIQESLPYTVQYTWISDFDGKNDVVRWILMAKYLLSDGFWRLSWEFAKKKFTPTTGSIGEMIMMLHWNLWILTFFKSFSTH